MKRYGLNDLSKKVVFLKQLYQSNIVYYFFIFFFLILHFERVVPFGNDVTAALSAKSIFSCI